MAEDGKERNKYDAEARANQGFKVLAGNPILQDMRRRIQNGNRAANIRKELGKPTLDLRSKYPTLSRSIGRKEN